MANENCLESYPFYVSDWRGSKAVSAMTAAEQGLYRNLLDICWQTGSLPINKNALQRLSFVSEAEFKKSWPAVSKMFVEKDGELHNEKVDERRPAVLRAKAARSRGAQVVNAKRWENGIAQRQDSDTASDRSAAQPADAKRSPSPSPSPSPEFLPAKNAGRNTLPDSTGISPAAPKTAPGGSVSSLALAVSADTEPERLAREWIGTFVAAGVALSEADVMRALRGVGETKGFLSHTLDEQRAIVAYTQAKAPTVTAQYLGLPVNLLAKGEWQRRAGPRVLPTHTASEAKRDATRQALFARLERDARERGNG